MESEFEEGLEGLMEVEGNQSGSGEGGSGPPSAMSASGSSSSGVPSLGQDRKEEEPTSWESE